MYPLLSAIDNQLAGDSVFSNALHLIKTHVEADTTGYGEIKILHRFREGNAY